VVLSVDLLSFILNIVCFFSGPVGSR